MVSSVGFLLEAGEEFTSGSYGDDGDSDVLCKTDDLCDGRGKAFEVVGAELCRCNDFGDDGMQIDVGFAETLLLPMTEEVEEIWGFFLFVVSKILTSLGWSDKMAPCRHHHVHVNVRGHIRVHGHGHSCGRFLGHDINNTFAPSLPVNSSSRFLHS